MIQFGPAGNCERFYSEGNKSSVQAPDWIFSQGLSAYEYAAGHGVSISEASAREIGERAAERGISVSIHAPYYINCGSASPENRLKCTDYLLWSAQAVDWMGGNRVIFHIGSPCKRSREEAFEDACKAILSARRKLDEAGYAHIHLCPETMGRPSQLGTLDEILYLCALDERMIPTIDFGHLHAAGRGCMKSEADFDAVIQRMIDRIGLDRVHNFHSHFSKIAYTAKGERQHVTFADHGYGPDFAHLAPVLLKRKLEPTVICESRGTQADDALLMQKIYRDLTDRKNVQ